MSALLPAILQEAIDSPKVTDICINGSGEAFADSGNGLEALWDVAHVPEKWGEELLRLWILDQISQVGKTWDARHPFVDATLPSGHRLHVVFPGPAQQRILVSLRRISKPVHDSHSSPSLRWKNSAGYTILRDAFVKGETVLLAGATGCGKTTLASDLLSEVAPHERILALEDTPELSPRHPHFVSLVSRPANADGFGEISLRTLLKQTLRMRPDRIVLGECRGTEVLELLQALNTGHRGTIATLHANSARDALRRMELLCHLSGEGQLNQTTIRELLACSIQWIAYLKRTGSERQIHEVVQIAGREGDTILLRPML